MFYNACMADKPGKQRVDCSIEILNLIFKNYIYTRITDKWRSSVREYLVLEMFGG